MGSSSLTRDWICAPWIGSLEWEQWTTRQVLWLIFKNYFSTFLLISIFIEDQKDENFFGHSMWLERILVFWPEIEPGPQEWKCWILTAVPPGNSQKDENFMNFRKNLPISAKSVGMEKAIVLNLQISLAVLPFTNIKSSDSWQYVFPFSLLYFKIYFLVFIVQGLYFLLNFTWVFYSYWWCGMELVNGN